VEDYAELRGTVTSGWPTIHPESRLSIPACRLGILRSTRCIPKVPLTLSTSKNIKLREPTITAVRKELAFGFVKANLLWGYSKLPLGLLTHSGALPKVAYLFGHSQAETDRLLRESLYHLDGNLYATFDSFNIDPVTLLFDKDPANATVSPALYRIDPSTGSATLIGPTNLNLGAAVAVDGEYYAFRLSVTGFTAGFPTAFSELVKLDLATGQTKFVRLIDPSAGTIFGAAPF
jgi:hypothetical protein